MSPVLKIHSVQANRPMVVDRIGLRMDLGERILDEFCRICCVSVANQISRGLGATSRLHHLCGYRLVRVVPLDIGGEFPPTLPHPPNLDATNVVRGCLALCYADACRQRGTRTATGRESSFARIPEGNRVWRVAFDSLLWQELRKGSNLVSARKSRQLSCRPTQTA